MPGRIRMEPVSWGRDGTESSMDGSSDSRSHIVPQCDLIFIGEFTEYLCHLVKR